MPGPSSGGAVARWGAGECQVEVVRACARSEVTEKHGRELRCTVMAVSRRWSEKFRTYACESGSETTGKRQERKEGLTAGLLLSSFTREVAGDDEATTIFRTGRGRGRRILGDVKVPGPDEEIVDEAEVEAVPRASSVELTVLHGAPATVSLSLCRSWFREEEKGEKERRRGERRRRDEEEEP